jgi:hypothetical protein
MIDFFLRATSPEQQKMARTLKSINDEFHLQEQDHGFEPPPGFTSSISSRPSSVGKHTEERINRRAGRSISPVNDVVVEEVLKVSMKMLLFAMVTNLFSTS